MLPRQLQEKNRMKFKTNIIFLFLLVGLVRVYAAADVITLKTKKTQDVTFEAFKTGRIYFKDVNNPKKASISKMFSTISGIELKPPGQVTIKYRNGKTDSSLKLHSYKSPNFIFVDKKGKQQSIAYRNISFLKMDMDFARIKAKQEPEGDGNVKEKAADFDIDSLAKKGVVTVVQLHMQDLMQSTGTWNYVKSLEDNKRIKVKPVRITIKDWDNPLLKKYDIKTLPQFWFYDKSGKLETKLIKRFTSNDIDAAVKKSNHL
jgi:thioredoxin-related protein